MAKRFRQLRTLVPILQSPELEKILIKLGEKVLEAASGDPNQAYVDSLDLQVFRSASRVSVQVGALPGLGNAVEAKRGTLARALAGAGIARAQSSDPTLVDYTTRDGRTRKATQAQVDAWSRSRK
jgi:hypothetical protein